MTRNFPLHLAGLLLLKLYIRREREDKYIHDVGIPMLSALMFSIVY